MKEKLNNILNRENPRFSKAVKLFWILFISIILLFPAYLYSVSIDLFGLFGEMPSVKVLENPENDLSSELITADGESLGRYYRYNRSQVDFDDLSPQLVETLIASEDIRYFEHSGLDLIAFLRVIKGIITFNLAGGGSTITQQLAKNLYTQNQELGLDGHIAKLGGIPKRVVEKTKEWIISIYLERNFTKEEIISMYLNTAEFSSNSYGIKVAAETYFDTTPDSLNYSQSAILVGMLQAPTRYNPARNPENAFKKRNEVLFKLQKYNVIAEDLYDSLRADSIDMSDYSVENHNTGMATYFRSLLRNDLINWADENDYDLFEDGLKIYVTIDSRMQKIAEQAVKEHMAELQQQFYKTWGERKPWRDEDGREIENYIEKRFRQTDYYRALVKKYGKEDDSVKIEMNRPKEMKVFTWKGEVDTVLSSLDSLKHYKYFLQSGFMAMDPKSGQVKAWVGGIDHRYFKYDHVKQGRRQPGSTFKTFVYGYAMLKNYKPCREMVDASASFTVNGKIWKPQNSEGGYGDGSLMTIRQAMARSVNSVTSQLMQEFGPQNIVDFAHQVGIQSELDAVPSLCLGTSDVSLFELLGAYSTFVNKGMHISPYYISRIEDKYGTVVYNSIPEIRQAISPEVAYKILYMLRGGVEEKGGTSVGLSWELKKGNEIGGKTGTTQNASDGWYVGVTKDLVAGAWVGGEERNIRFRSWADGQGGKTARPIWDKFMTQIYAEEALSIEKGAFPRPIGGIDAQLDCNLYKIQEEDSTRDQSVDKWDPTKIE